MSNAKTYRLAKDELRLADQSAREARIRKNPDGTESKVTIQRPPAAQYQEPKRKTWSPEYWHFVDNVIVMRAQRKDFKGKMREQELRVVMGKKYVPILDKAGNKIERSVPVYRDGTPKFERPTLTEMPDVQS